MNTVKTLFLPVLCGAVLFAGCNPESPTLPEPPGVPGLCDQGWEYYAAGDFTNAMESFQDAIDADVTYPEAYLGAGWTSIHLSDYWVMADNYFYMALQLDQGNQPLLAHSGELVQDTAWTVFECVNPVLPDSVMFVITSLGDTLPDWPEPGDTTKVTKERLGFWLFGIYGDMDFTYRFDAPENTICMLNAFNNTTFDYSTVDSVAGGYVYLTAPHTFITVSGDSLHIWIGADDHLSFDYETYQPGTLTQTSYDALAGWALLQEIRDANGDRLLGCSAARALFEGSPDYSFGLGTSHADLEEINPVNIMGTAASMAVSEQCYRYALNCCRTVGYALDLNPNAPFFLPNLLSEIEAMLAYSE